MEYLDNMTEAELAEFMRQDRLRMIRDKRNALLAECDWTQAVIAHYQIATNLHGLHIGKH